MEIKIQIDEEQFKELLEKEFNNLSKETLHSILMKSFKEALVANDSKILKDLLMEKDDRYYSSYRDHYIPTNFTRSIINSATDTSKVQEIFDLMIDDIKNNHREIMLQLFSSMVASSLADDWSFKEKLNCAIQNQINMFNSMKNDQ
jgi:hypothetical protein